MYTSDHDENFGDHGMQWKAKFHEPSPYVPFVMHLPINWDDRAAGTICDEPVQLADILSTFLSVGGGDVPDGLDGTDLLPVARGESSSQDYLEGLYDDRYLTLTDDDWKYVWYPTGGVEHLFDLASGPTRQ